MKDPEATPVDIALDRMIEDAAPKRYIFNSVVITTPGVYSYHLVDLDETRRWLAAGGWKSTIGYAETAAALGELTGVEVPVSREITKMVARDEALVFRLVFSKGYRPDIHKKGKLGKKFILGHCEMGILTKVADDAATGHLFPDSADVCGY